MLTWICLFMGKFNRPMDRKTLSYTWSQWIYFTECHWLKISCLALAIQIDFGRLSRADFLSYDIKSLFQTYYKNESTTIKFDIWHDEIIIKCEQRDAWCNWCVQLHDKTIKIVATIGNMKNPCKFVLSW